MSWDVLRSSGSDHCSLSRVSLKKPVNSNLTFFACDSKHTFLWIIFIASVVLSQPSCGFVIFFHGFFGINFSKKVHFNLLSFLISIWSCAVSCPCMFVFQLQCPGLIFHFLCRHLVRSLRSPPFGGLPGVLGSLHGKATEGWFLLDRIHVLPEQLGLGALGTCEEPLLFQRDQCSLERLTMRIHIVIDRVGHTVSRCNNLVDGVHRPKKVCVCEKKRKILSKERCLDTI